MASPRPLQSTPISSQAYNSVDNFSELSIIQKSTSFNRVVLKILSLF